eukprot:TRINITY_DN2918_c2_g1_i2.p1 TRINITY_DN2918_c2_g1~~TRINITY_DN2918_c2_g1_i2.p1  ORF type:complete len:635 (+),score=177.57 TRINITY_DN2918_c2_g1_i2:134-1906(+)
MKSSLRKRAIDRCASNSGSSSEMLSSMDSDNVSKDEWFSMSLARHSDVVEMLERARVLMKRETSARSFNSDRTASRHVVNHQNVTALIIKYLRANNLNGSAAALEADAKIDPFATFDSLDEDLLEHLLLPGIHDVSSILEPEGRELDIDETIEQPQYDFQPLAHQEQDVGQSISIWDDAPESEQNLVLKPSETDPKTFTVKSGTFNKIITFLTSEVPKDLQIRSVFLATYLSYCSADTLLEKLIERYNAPESVDASEAKAVQLRVVLIFKAWMEGNPEHFSDQQLERLRQFISNLGNEKLAKNLRTAMAKMQSNTTEQLLDVSQCPSPIVPKNIFSTTLALTDVEPEEVARQLTLIDHGYVAPITLSELITMQWIKQDTQKFASSRYNKRFNIFVQWCIGSVLKLRKYKERAEKLAWLITVAHHLFKIKSYSSCYAVYFALSHGSVARLTHTLSALPKHSRAMWRDLCHSLKPSCGFSSYRAEFHSNKPPRIPFLGAHYQELIQIDSSFPDFVEDMINFEKRKLQFEAVDEVLRYANVGYSFLPVHQIQTFLQNFDIPFADDEAMYRQSQKIEPKGITASELVEQEKMLS